MRGDKPGEPTLRATSAAVRALPLFMGTLANKEECVKFVEKCHDPVTGGFADTPGGLVDVVTTSVGLMAVAELKMPAEKLVPAAVKYLSAQARTFEEIRISAAGLETVPAKSPKTDNWLKVIDKLRNDDGSFGKGLGQARATGSGVVALLRFGIKIDNPDHIVKILQAGQRRNGGFGKDDSEVDADLGTCYRIVRCFHMLKAQPKDVEGLRSFIAKCRNDDGGYAISPGGDSSLDSTYYAAKYPALAGEVMTTSSLTTDSTDGTG